jgi:hypothetical protein
MTPPALAPEGLQVAISHLDNWDGRRRSLGEESRRN